MQLKDRVVLITGGARGLGYATAQAMAREGARVIINDLRGEAAMKAAATLGPQHIGLPGDVSKEADVNDMVDLAIKEAGRIDILVNNAGIGDSFVPTVDQSLAHWQRLIDIHLTGTYLVSKTVAPHMIKAGGGAMVNLNSIAGVMGLSVRTAYSAAKAGIGMLTRTLGCEWAPHRLRVNAVAPGYILTEMVEQMIADKKLDQTRILRRTPMGQWGRPEHVAEAILFLASDRAQFITGVTLPVDGGYMAWGAPSDAYPLADLPTD